MPRRFEQYVNGNDLAKDAVHAYPAGAQRPGFARHRPVRLAMSANTL